MKPKPFVQLQAGAVMLLTVCALAIFGHEVALALAVLLLTGALVWAVFGVRYRLLLLRRRRRLEGPADGTEGHADGTEGHADGRVSALRASRDRVMLVNFVVGILVPGLAAALVAALDARAAIDPPLQDSYAVLVALSVVAFPVSMIVSSSVDWYLIRPFREGVHGDPVCQDSAHADDRSLDYARYWIGHRMLSELLVYFSVVGLIAMTAVLVGNATSSQTGENLLNVLGFLGVGLWSLVEMTKLRWGLLFVRRPSHAALGAWVRGQNPEPREISGFVLDLALEPGVQLIEKPRGYPAGDISDDERSVPLTNRRSIKPIKAPRPTCPGKRCEFWVPDCEVGLRALERARAQQESSED